MNTIPRNANPRFAHVPSLLQGFRTWVTHGVALGRLGSLHRDGMLASAILSICAFLFPTAIRAQSSSCSINFQGVLNGTGGALLPNNRYDLTFRFHTNATVGTAIATSTVPQVPVTNGVASAAIPVQPGWFDGSSRWLGITVSGQNGGQELPPRVLVTAVPYAMTAGSIFNPFQGFQGLEMRRTNDTPYIDFTRSWTPADLDFDYRMYVDVLGSDPRFVIRSDIAQNCIVVTRNGYVGIGGGFPEDALDVNGTARMVVCKITSDRNAKTAFRPVDTRAVLEKLAALPLTTWSYTNNPAIRHLGPVAQDFAEAFGMGEDNKHIATVDADGVLFASVQALHQLVREKDAKLHDLEERLAAPEERGWPHPQQAEQAGSVSKPPVRPSSPPAAAQESPTPSDTPPAATVLNPKPNPLPTRAGNH